MSYFMYFCPHTQNIVIMNSLIFPSYVQKVIVSSPFSFQQDRQVFLKGAKKRLKSWGLEVVMAKHAGSSHGRMEAASNSA